PYYDYRSPVTTTSMTGAPTLGPGQATQPGTLAFFDPNGMPFTYTLVFLGRLNHPPRFTSAPVVTVIAGQNYQYHATAYDPDGDPLSFSVVAGPTALGFTNAGAADVATWATATADAGTYPV